MNSHAQVTDHRLLRRLSRWWRDLVPASIVTQLGRAETSRVATDVGLSVSDLESVNRTGGNDPMSCRMASLGLNEAETVQRDPAVVRDLQRVCALCDDKAQCRHELNVRPDDTSWQTYCPNMQTFNALLAERGTPKS